MKSIPHYSAIAHESTSHLFAGEVRIAGGCHCQIRFFPQSTLGREGPSGYTICDEAPFFVSI